MANLKYDIDNRLREDKTAQIKIKITANGSRCFIGTGICVEPDNFDGYEVHRRRDRNQLNTILTRLMNLAESTLLDLKHDGRLKDMSCQDIKAELQKVLKIGVTRRNTRGLLVPSMRAFADLKSAAKTKQTYNYTASRIEDFDPKAKSLKFEDISLDWLTRFERFLAQTSPSQNARNIHLRNIRAVFNYAIDNEVTTAYPFRRFKIRPVPTRKRSLSVEALRRLFDAEVEDYIIPHRDMFKLIFFLIGINMVDLCHLKDIVDGRIEYVRAKTHRPYSIKVEPEALEIINKYRGRGQLLNIMDRYQNHADYTKRCNKALQAIGDMKREGRGGRKLIEPWFPGLTTYWARHTWATIAASLDIPKETIAAALGHSQNTVTDIYIAFDRRKIDEANRRVIDYVLQKQNGVVQPNVSDNSTMTSYVIDIPSAGEVCMSSF